MKRNCDDHHSKKVKTNDLMFVDFDFFNLTAASVNLKNSPRIRSQNNLQLPYRSNKEEQCGGTQKGIKFTSCCKKHSLNRVSALAMEVVHL